MPQEYKEPLSLTNGKFLEGQLSSGASERLAGISDKDANPSRHRTPGTVRHEFARLGEPLAGKALGAGACTGTAGDINRLLWRDLAMEYFIIGTQTIVCPSTTDIGFDLNSMDQTNNDGAQYGLVPVVRTVGDYCFTIGTSPAFYIEAKIKIEDVSGSDALLVGFYRGTAYAADYNDYTDQALIGNISGAIKHTTSLNNAANVTTDTTQTWADAATHTVTVKVSAAGVVTYLVDGANPTATAAFTFDTGDIVKPLIYVINDADVLGKAELIYLECGFEK